MKRPLRSKTLAKEAAFWQALKKAVGGNPGKVCHK